MKQSRGTAISKSILGAVQYNTFVLPRRQPELLGLGPYKMAGPHGTLSPVTTHQPTIDHPAPAAAASTIAVHAASDRASW
jgi:hypothetical protein